MEYELKTPIEIRNNDTGENEEHKKIKVSYMGEDGLSTMLKIQGEIMKGIQSMGRGDRGDNVVSKSKDTGVTEDVLVSMVDFSPSCHEIYNMIMNSFSESAMIGSSLLVKKIRNKLSLDDMHDLCTEVLKVFLFPRLIQRCFNMNN